MTPLKSQLINALRRIYTLAWLESLLIRRDPTILSLILIVPALQIILFGYAIQPLGHNVPVVIARAQSHSGLIAELEKKGQFKVVADGLSKEQALEKIRTQQALIAIVLPSAIDNNRSPTNPATMTLYVDDSNPLRANPALSALEAQYWQHLVSLTSTTIFIKPSITVQRLYNPENKNNWIMTPTLSGVIVMISMLMLGALSIVREREQGTWEALLATPVYAFEAVMGKALPYLVLGLIQALLVMGCGYVLFDLPLRGSIPFFSLFLFFYTLVHIVIGITLSAAAKNQMQAIQGAVLFYLPSMLLSGFLFPYENMPSWAQQLGKLFPLTYYVEAARGFFLRGADPTTLLALTNPMLVFLAISFVLATIIFRRRL